MSAKRSSDDKRDKHTFSIPLSAAHKRKIGALVIMEKRWSRRFTKLFRLSFIVFYLVSSWGCSSSAERTSTVPISFARDIEPVFSSCIGCHNLNSFSGGLDLSPGVAYKNLVNVRSDQTMRRYVLPGSPETSYLLNKVTEEYENLGGGGVRMPLGGPYLSGTRISQIQRWINDGAINN